MLDLQRFGEPAGDRRIIGGGAGKGLGRQLLAEIQRQRAEIHLQRIEHRGIVGGVGDDGDIGVVLGRGADHRRAADVDVLDDRRVVGAGAADLLERVEVDDDEIDRLDAVIVHRLGVLGVVAHAEQAAMHRRVQRLDAAVHDLGKAGELGDVAAPAGRRRRSPLPCRRWRPARRRPRPAPWRNRRGRSCRRRRAARGGRERGRARECSWRRRPWAGGLSGWIGKCARAVAHAIRKSRRKRRSSAAASSTGRTDQFVCRIAGDGRARQLPVDLGISEALKASTIWRLRRGPPRPAKKIDSSTSGATSVQVKHPAVALAAVSTSRSCSSCSRLMSGWMWKRTVTKSRPLLRDRQRRRRAGTVPAGEHVAVRRQRQLALVAEAEALRHSRHGWRRSPACPAGRCACRHVLRAADRAACRAGR